jgi:O-antigen/teichoic acid export membrane protein
MEGSPEKSVSIVGKLKELMKHGLIYGLTSSLQSVLGFILLPILTIYYTPDIFGVYSLLLLMSALSSAIFYLGASSSLGRYYFEHDSDEYKKKAVSTALFITLAGATFLIVITSLLSPFISRLLFDSEKYSTVVLLSIIGGSAFSFLLTLMTLILRYEKKSAIFFIVSISGVLLNFSITYVLLTKFEMGILAPIYGVLVSNGLSFIALLLYRLKSITFDLDSSMIKSYLNFGIQASAAGILVYILDWVDRIIIKDLLDLGQVGIYSLGYRLGAIINVLVIMPFSLIWAPMRMQYSKNSNADKFTTKIISYYTLIGVALIVISILFSEELLSLFFSNKEYAGAAKVYPIIMFSMLMYGYQGIVDYGIYFHKKVYLYMVAAIVGIGINILLNFIFIPIYGYIAAAYVTLITYTFTSGLLYFISNRLYVVKIEWTRISALILLLIFIYNIVTFFQIIFIVKIFILIVLLLSLYFIWVDEDEKKYIGLHVKKLLKIN